MARKKKARTKFAGTRVNNEMDRWLTRWARDCSTRDHEVTRSEVVAIALGRYRVQMERAASGGRDITDIDDVPRACSCSPDDRAKDGCRCGAEVGR